LRRILQGQHRAAAPDEGHSISGQENGIGDATWQPEAVQFGSY
jgi:hypothetical protein